MGDGFLGLIFILLILALYFLPFIIALIRDVRNKTSVFFLNLFLGWTIIGFFVLIFYASLTNASSNVSVAEFAKKNLKDEQNNNIVHLTFI